MNLSSFNASTITNGTNATHLHVIHEEHVPPFAVLFIFSACCIGALCRQIMKGWPIPYTVLLIFLGLVFGVVSASFQEVQRYTAMATKNPHLILTTFLPVLLFESAFAMDVHTFYKMFWQITFLAVICMALAAALSGVMAKLVFTYEWSWFEALMFGSIISATDPVAVVALLNELGAPKQLSTIIEGESLLNDGMAIVLYKIFYNLSFSSMTATEIGLYFPRVALGGFFFGLITGKVVVFWLQRVFNDAMVEITITLASTYLTYYIGEEVLGISGVLAVVMLGIEINAQKSSISPEVEVFLHKFWEMLAYLANTLIFIMVGVVIMEKAVSEIDLKDGFLIIVDYMGVTVIRAVVLLFSCPILFRIGYGLSWQSAVILCWGGLRGAVGLALALQVALDYKHIGSKVLLHTAGIVIFTLFLNATTIKKLLELLGMSEISDSKKVAMANGVKRLKETTAHTFKMLKTDRFLADANWSLAEDICKVENPYIGDVYEQEEGSKQDLLLVVRHSTCPGCSTLVPNQPSPKEFAEMTEEGRVRMIKAQKVSYWKQFEHGMLSRDAVQTLMATADTVMDTKDRCTGLADLKQHWEVPPFLQKLKDKVQSWKKLDPTATIPPPEGHIPRQIYDIVTNFWFDTTVNCLIIVNMIPISLELTSDEDDPNFIVLRVLNYIFCSIYVSEAVLKIISFRRYYFTDKWNILDFTIVILSVVDILIDLATNGATGSFSPAILRVARVFRILRMGRLLRLLKSLLPKIIDMLNNIIYRQLSFGYDVGKGFVVGEEEVSKNINDMVADKRVARDLKTRSEKNRLDVLKSLGLLQREYPGIAISVKTRQSIRSVLNTAMETVHHLRGGGLLDETEAQKLEKLIEIKMKRQLSAPSYVAPPSPETVLRSIVWLEGMDSEVIDYIATLAEEKLYDTGEMIVKQGDQPDGVYLIISGLVKMVGVSIPRSDSDESRFFEMDISTDYLCAGNILGEMGLLTASVRNASATCETPVQAYFLPLDGMEQAVRQYPQLAERIWRVCSIRIAVPLLMSHPSYASWTREKVRLFCEKSSMASLPPRGQTTFQPSNDVVELVLIRGKVSSMANRDVYEAPCVLPNKDRLVLNYDYGPPKLLEIKSQNNSHGIVGDSAQEGNVTADIGSAPSSSSFGGTEAKFRGKSGNRALDPIPEKYKGKHHMTSSSIAKNGDSSKFVEVSDK